MLSGRRALVLVRAVLDLRRLQDDANGKLFQGVLTVQTGVLHLRVRVHPILRRMWSHDVV